MIEKVPAFALALHPRATAPSIEFTERVEGDCNYSPEFESQVK